MSTNILIQLRRTKQLQSKYLLSNVYFIDLHTIFLNDLKEKDLI